MKTAEVRQLILEVLSGYLEPAGWKCVKSKELFKKKVGEFEFYYLLRVFTGAPCFESIRIETSFAINSQAVRDLLCEVLEEQKTFKGMDFRYSIFNEYSGRGSYWVAIALEEGLEPIDYLQSGVLSDFREVVEPIFSGMKTIKDLEGFVIEKDWDDGVFRYPSVRRILGNIALTYLADNGNFKKVADDAYHKFVRKGANDDAELIVRFKSHCESRKG